MKRRWQLRALAAALTIIASTRIATAQTVVATGVSEGTTVELVWNTETVTSAPADASGNATLAASLLKPGGKKETEVSLFVDQCRAVTRVLVVEAGQSPPPRGEGCDRNEIVGLFVLRPVTTFLVSFRTASPTVWLRQGSVPASWLRPEPESGSVTRNWRPSPTGLVLFSGGGYATLRDVVPIACGNVGACSGSEARGAAAAGGAYWFTRFLAAEASFVKHARVTAQGSGSTFHFNSFFTSRIVTLAGKGAVPLGPVRLYGTAGVNYHVGTFSTTETIDDLIAIIDDEEVIFKGGTQTFELLTRGWGWLLGGGGEFWLNRWVGVYGELTRARLRGAATNQDEGEIDDRATFLVFGVRVHLGR